MPSPFDAFDAAAQAVIDATFGEGIRIEPMRAGNYAAGADPDRPVRATRATVSRAPGVRKTNYPSTNRQSADVAASPTEAWIDRAAYAALGYPLRRGDIIILTDDARTPRFEVTACHETDGGDVQVLLASVPGSED